MPLAACPLKKEDEAREPKATRAAVILVRTEMDALPKGRENQSTERSWRDWNRGTVDKQISNRIACSFPGRGILWPL